MRVYFSGFLNINKIFKYVKFAWLFSRSYKWRSFLFYGLHLLQSYGYNDVNWLKIVFLTDQIIWIIPPSQTRPHIIQKKIHTLKIVQILKTEINLVGPVEIKVQLGVWRKYCLGAGILEIGVLRRHRVNQMVQAFCLVFLVKCLKKVSERCKTRIERYRF